MFYVYVIKSLSNYKYYIGSTNDLERRLEDHNRGKNKSVRGRGPFEIIYKEPCQTRLEATQRERQIKSYKGGAAFKRLISKQNIDPIV